MTIMKSPLPNPINEKKDEITLALLKDLIQLAQLNDDDIIEKGKYIQWVADTKGIDRATLEAIRKNPESLTSSYPEEEDERDIFVNEVAILLLCKSLCKKEEVDYLKALCKNLSISFANFCEDLPCYAAAVNKTPEEFQIWLDSFHNMAK